MDAEQKDDYKTPVIFRKWRHHDTAGDGIIALFPEMNGTYDPHTCGSYEHVGQHGSATPDDVITLTRPASPDEYRDLYNELTGIGYNLDVRLRIRHTGESDYVKRKKQLEANGGNLPLGPQR